MAIEIQKPRPPYVMFETKAVEDRAASEAAGSYRSKDVDYAYITPQGSKDRIMRVATEWLAHLKVEVAQERYPKEWLNFYEDSYSAWKKGQEIPLSGTPVKNWPFPSPSQINLMLDLNLRTVEDVASANEEAIRRMGMGGQSLKQAAVNFLQSASDGGGKLVMENDRLKAENQALKVRNDSLEAQVQELASQVRLLQPPSTEMRAI